MRLDLPVSRSVIHQRQGREMSQVSDWSHDTLLAADLQSPWLAREFVSRHLRAHHLSHLVEDVRLVVSELATNAVAHAQTPFVVTLSSANGSVLLDVQDGSTTAVAPSTPGATDMSGRGMMIVELLCHEWGTSSDGEGSKSVWASFPSAT